MASVTYCSNGTPTVAFTTDAMGKMNVTEDRENVGALFASNTTIDTDTAAVTWAALDTHVVKSNGAFHAVNTDTSCGKQTHMLTLYCCWLL